VERHDARKVDLLVVLLSALVDPYATLAVVDRSPPEA
jgi:hypothetical protein